MSDTKKEEEALNQLQAEQGWLLDKIDELRIIGVGGLVELPQLIVCGNQSSGKSSVLEAISRVRFPMKSNLCTRFATEVSLRRAPTTRFKVTIEPGLSRKGDYDWQKLREFSHSTFTNGDQLPALIEKAKECMGITGDVGFSDDILKIEISGPDKPELTLVDLPGLYYSTSASQGQEGIQIVRNLTERYMKNTRSIILAVLSAKADLHVQEVLNMAEKFDPTRERTIGIVTQPDALEAHSEEEESWLQNIRNQNVRLQLGWHALRNRSFETRNVSDDERDVQEREFFRQGKWNSIARDCVGIDSLRRRLSGVLLKHIRQNLPGLISDVDAKVLDRQSRLKKLGDPRSTLQQQKGFLLGLSSSFERITGQALDGMYTDDFFGGLDNSGPPDTQDARRLRAVIRDLNEYFAEAMDARGCQRFIQGVNGENYPLPPNRTNPYINLRQPECKTRSNIEDEVSELARRGRGIELPGSANQLLVGTLFRDQSRPWEELAQHHLIKTWESVSSFVNLVLQNLTDEHTFQSLVGIVIGPELDKIQTHLLAKLDELTAYNKRGHPLPLNKSFLARIQKARSDRLVSKLSKSLASGLFADGKYTVEDIKQATKKLESSSDQFAAAEIIDQMQAYYDNSMATFIDNIATLAIENCLLNPLSSIFTCQTINNMEDKEVQNLAAEPSFVTEERDRLTNDLEKLQAGVRVLNQFKLQKTTVLPARPVSNPKQDPPQASTPAADINANGRSKALTQLSAPSTATPSAPASTSPFGAVRPTSPARKSQASKPAGTSSSSPSTQSGLFSNPKPATPSGGGLFGGLTSTSTSTSPFGKSGGSLFGKPSNDTTTGFGQPAQSSGFGTPMKGGLFGQSVSSSENNTTKPPGFGSTSNNSGSLFGPNSLNSDVSYDFPVYPSGHDAGKYMHISSIQKFGKLSPEEIRLRDYQLLGKVK